MESGGRDYLIKRFREEGLESYRSIIKFYERNEDELNTLEFSDYFSIFLEYVDALYEIGAHHKFLRYADQVLELSIERNIVFFQGKDIFQYFVLKKALAFLNLCLLDKCEKVVFELLKMEPDNKEYRSIMQKVYHRRRSVRRINMRMYGVFFILFSAFVIFMDLAFFPVIGMEVRGLDLLRLLLFTVGIGLIGYTEVASTWHSRSEMLKKVTEARNYKEEG
jgi:hypothetical protein